LWRWDARLVRLHAEHPWRFYALAVAVAIALGALVVVLNSL